jgi:cell division protein FtsN
VATRVGGGSGASDSTLGGIASAGGTRGAGMTALAKLLAVCAGTVGGAACVATGVIPAPLIDHPTHHAKPAAKVIHHRPQELAHDEAQTTSSFPDYDTATPGEVEPQPQPRETAQLEGEAQAKREREDAEEKARDEEKAAEREASTTAAQSSPPETENGATEYVEPAPPPPPPSEPSSSTSSAGTSAATSSSATALSGDGSKGTAAGELGP